MSVELPLAADWDVLRTPLADLGLALLEQRPARELAVEARRTTRRHWDSLGGRAISTLRQMRAEYEVRLAYLDDAIADVDARGPRSLIAPHVATRLAERLVLESQLCGDVLDDLDSDAATDELWVGSTLGLMLQHEAWRLDGPHTNGLHSVPGPFSAC